MTTSTITKAEQKRIKDATYHIDLHLRKRLIDFENEYLNHAANWAVKEIKIEIDRFKKLIQDIKDAEIKRHGWEVTIQNHEYKISLLEKKIELDAILKMTVFNEAKASYDKKINKIVELLVMEGFSHLHFRIEDMYNNGSKLEFLISNNIKEVHARLIYAHGEIKAPHFRFITTVRQK